MNQPSAPPALLTHPCKKAHLGAEVGAVLGGQQGGQLSGAQRACQLLLQVLALAQVAHEGAPAWVGVHAASWESG